MVELFVPEGATPIHDVSGLKLRWLKTRDQLNEVEADNILKAFSTYFKRRQHPSIWLNEKTLKKIHRDMFGQVWNWAGVYYRGPKRNIGIDAFQIPFQVVELCKDVHYWLQDNGNFSILEQCARIHHRLAFIHPFENGNGRYARFIADLYAYSLCGEKPIWPENTFSQEGDLRKDYIQALKRADIGDYSHLLLVIKKYADGTSYLV